MNPEELKDEIEGSRAEKDLRRTLLGYMEKMADDANDTESKIYREYGDFRAALSPDEILSNDALFDLRDRLGCEPKECYYNAFQAVLERRDDMVYVEGYTVSERLQTPIKHAWVEVDGEVWELTLPRHIIKESGLRLYYGCEYDTEDVLLQAMEKECVYPMADSRNDHITPDGSFYSG